MAPKTEQPFIETDAAGCLYDRRIRQNISRAVPQEEVAASEALAALRMASHGFRTMMDRWLERHGMSEGRLSVLWLLRVKNDMTLGELAERLDVSPRNITGLVDHLEQDSLVERFPDPDDRRGVIVRLTPDGKAAVDGAFAALLDAEHQLLADLPDRDRQRLAALLRTLLAPYAGAK